MIRQLSLNRINLMSKFLERCLNVLIILVSFWAVDSYSQPFSSFEGLHKKSKFVTKRPNNLASDIVDKNFAQSKEGLSKESACSSTNKEPRVSLNARNNNSSNAILTFTLENINHIEENFGRPHATASQPLRSPPDLFS